MKIIDLFCGAGGFTLGAHAAGFETALAIDVDPILSSAITFNHPNLPFFREDLAEVSSSKLFELSGSCRPDGVIGGPPCQGFSEIGRGDRNDPRNELLSHFYRHVAHLGPRFFIMENVRGILIRYGRELLNEALKQVERDYRIIGPILIHGNEFGAPTSRPRVLVIGIHRDERTDLSKDDFVRSATGAPNVRDAIEDLADAKFVETDEDGFDVWTYGSITASAYAQVARSKDGRQIGTFTGHSKVLHSEVVTKRFAAVEPGKVDAVGRHPRLAWGGVAPTIRAGTGSDKGSYQSVRPLHPSLPRVITVREAARLQGFPDWYSFHPTVWHSFRMIGNSVPPPVSKNVLKILSDALRLMPSPVREGKAAGGVEPLALEAID